MQSSIRAFIAVEINEAVRAGLEKIQQELIKAAAHVSWVKPQNIHSTLVFLGDVFPEMVDPLAAAIKQAVAGAKPFEIEVRGIGYFGSPRSPRIVWAGMTGEVAPLVKLQGKIVAAMLLLGLQPDQKPFRPHLTIGRVRSNRNAAALIEAIAAGKDEFYGKVVVQRVILMKSVLSSQGPEYSLLRAARLGDEKIIQPISLIH